jgi:HPt (histidine-containing phosphotransfer) domain-containing protein
MLIVGNEVTTMVLDRDAALERVGGDRELLSEIAKLFLEDYPSNISSIRTAIEQKNAKELERSAHMLKGAVANFAAPGAVEAAFQLEKIGRGGQLDEAWSAFDVLLEEFQRLHPALEALV